MRLRRVEEGDLEAFFVHQLDPIAARMAAFPSRNHADFREHWSNILADAAVTKCTIVVNGEVVGNIGAWEQDGHREIGYWIGRRYWGQGYATQAVSLFVEAESTRPLMAFVAEHNVGSRRVLEKCGFVRQPGQAPIENGVPHAVMVLG